MAEKEIEEQPLQLLRTVYELSGGDPARFVYVHEVAQKMGMGTVQYEKDRDEFTTLARELEEAGHIKRESDSYHFFFEKRAGHETESESRAEGYGFFSITDEGRSRVEEDQR